MRLLLLLFAAILAYAKQPLVVISVDGLDNRYLTDADQMRLKIPNLRQLMKEGQVSKGVIGAVPTITWPSHTTIITGVDPIRHGILSNWRPPGDRFLDYAQIKTPTILGAAHDAGLKIATVNWPVTVNAPVDWNLPEYFQRRRGGSMDTVSVESKARPADLGAEIARAYPSYPQEWMDDRTRALAVVYLIEKKRPDLLLVHLVDLDSEEHDNAPFSRESNAILERTDELIGQIIRSLPKESALAIVSDHGFERVNKMVDVRALAARQGVTNLVSMGGVIVASDEKAAAFLRGIARDAQSGVGREIPPEELLRFPSSIPLKAAAVFEPADGFMFSFQATPEIYTKPQEIGNHGFWPTRYRAVYILWGQGIKQEKLPEISIKQIAGLLAGVIGVPFAAH